MNTDRDSEGRAELEAAYVEVERTPWLLLMLGNVRERMFDDKGAIAAFEELLALQPEHAEALDRVAHLYIINGDRLTGRARAKEAHRLGFSTVYDALEADYYKPSVGARPRHRMPEHLIAIRDAPWSGSKS